MENSSEPRYEFLIMKRSVFPPDDLKTILCKRIIKSKENTICYEGIEDVKPAQAYLEGMLWVAYGVEIN